MIGYKIECYEVRIFVFFFGRIFVYSELICV